MSNCCIFSPVIALALLKSALPRRIYWSTQLQICSHFLTPSSLEWHWLSYILPQGLSWSPNAIICFCAYPFTEIVHDCPWFIFSLHAISENPNLFKYKCELWRALRLSEFSLISASHSDLLTTPNTVFNSSVAFVFYLITGTILLPSSSPCSYQ